MATTGSRDPVSLPKSSPTAKPDGERYEWVPDQGAHERAEYAEERRNNGGEEGRREPNKLAYGQGSGGGGVEGREP